MALKPVLEKNFHEEEIYKQKCYLHHHYEDITKKRIQNNSTNIYLSDTNAVEAHIYETIEDISKSDGESNLDKILSNQKSVSESDYQCYGVIPFKPMFDDRLVSLNLENGWKELEEKRDSSNNEFKSFR